MAGDDLFSELNETPFWWKEAAPETVPFEISDTTFDVAVVGAGYTGLSAALTLVKAGHSVVVLDSEKPGFGASSRNGGMIGNLLKPGLGGLMSMYGEDKGKAIYREALASVDFIKQRIGEEEIDCDLQMNGRFYPAVQDAHLKSMTRDFELRQKHLDVPEEMVGRGEYGEDVDSAIYKGGLRQHHTGGLHPAKYVKGLANTALKAGAELITPVRAEKISRTQEGFTLVTSGPEIRCRQLLIATNGYSGPLFPFVQKRVISIGSTIIATEELSENLVTSLFPTKRMITDTRKMLSYYRPSPDGKHVLLGGRPTVFQAEPLQQAKALHRRLTSIFPQLETTAVSHVWSGKVAYGFNPLPTIGSHEGIYYAMGYCGSGVAMSGYMGHKAALKILSHADGETAFDDLPFEDRFYYNGTPWFLPPAMIGYKIRDYFGF
jgi:glycine/D-amino acid oxidase-like deaminating enzyme